MRLGFPPAEPRLPVGLELKGTKIQRKKAHPNIERQKEMSSDQM